jgi:hypothetical protein
MTLKEQSAQEINELYKARGSVKPEDLVEWASHNTNSALHKRFNWDDESAAHAHRLQQARGFITEVTVIMPNLKPQQVYVSPIEQRGKEGYSSFVEVMSDAQRRARFVSQALEEYQRVGQKYASLLEFGTVRDAVEEVAKALEASREQAA